MINYITQGSTLTIQSAVLKDKEANLSQEKEKMKNELLKEISLLDPQQLVVEEDRANCKYLTLKVKFN